MANTSGERHAFQAEVSKLLGLMANSLYRDKEIFLRELISNASDACDKLRYSAITQPDLLGDDAALAVTITPDSKSSVLVVADNGIGMNRQELIDNLGTIARSGTEAFVKQMADAQSGDGQDEQDGAAAGLIGQFGVGFYSSFMVAKRVEVVTRRADETEGWRWRSDGTGSFSIAPEADAARGTRIELHLRKDAREFLEPLRIRTIVKAYSDHVGLPIWLENEGGQKEMVNEGSALWSRPRSEIDEDQYREFYHHIAHMPGDPWHTIHLHAEGRIEYTALLFVPDTTPFDLFDPIRRHRVRLYVRRVFITDECEGLIPPYLRFMRGVVDSSDLALNVSRETLQNDPILAKIRTGLVKRVFSELEKRAKKTPEEYASFWENFGAVLKEGLYEDAEQKDRLLPLVRFRSTGGGERWLSLDDYVDAMPEQQEAIYYMSGEDPDTLRRSPPDRGFSGARHRRAAHGRPGRSVLAARGRLIQGEAVPLGHPGRGGPGQVRGERRSQAGRSRRHASGRDGQADRAGEADAGRCREGCADLRALDRQPGLPRRRRRRPRHAPGAAAAPAQARAAGAEARAGDQPVARPDPRAGADGRSERRERSTGGRRAPSDGSGSYPRRRTGARPLGLHPAPFGSRVARAGGMTGGFAPWPTNVERVRPCRTRDRPRPRPAAKAAPSRRRRPQAGCSERKVQECFRANGNTLAVSSRRARRCPRP